MDIYSKIVAKDQLEPLSRFFQQTLSISDASSRDLTAELREKRQRDYQNFDHIVEIYEYI